MNNSAFRALSYGVYVLSTWDNGRPTGCTVNSVVQITSSPATVAVSVNKNNYTHECIERSGNFAISVLHEQSDPSIIGTFGFSSGRDTDKFDKVDYSVKGMLPVVNNAAAYIVCEVEKTLETDTHTVFLGKITDADVLENKPPMTYSISKKKRKKANGSAPYADTSTTERLLSRTFPTTSDAPSANNPNPRSSKNNTHRNALQSASLLIGKGRFFYSDIWTIRMRCNSFPLKKSIFYPSVLFDCFCAR